MVSLFLKLKNLFSILVLMLLFQVATAQITVIGNVSDAISSETLIGATIQIKGTTSGTISDIDGNYTIHNVPVDGVLRFSYMGYLNEEVTVNGNTTINVLLMPNIAMLSEMVVIGYGVVRKSDLTGSVAVVTSEDLNRIPTSNFTQALQGRAPGVMVSQSGSPGANAQIRIRGIGSINRNASPIYVIDGVISGSLNSVNPADIETIQVLKDASAAAIYGADGANGVILITTKRGTTGVPQVHYSSYLSMNSVPRKFDLMNADQYSAFYNQLEREQFEVSNPTGTFIPSNSYTDRFRQFYYGEGWQQGTDWQDEITRTGMAQNHYVRISGGGESSNYSISVNYTSEQGTLHASSAERFGIRANSDFSIGQYIKVGESFSITRSEGENPYFYEGNAWLNSLIASPLMLVYNENNKGGFEGPQVNYRYENPNDPNDTITNNTGFNDKPNPLGPMKVADMRQFNTGILTSIYLEAKPVSWLTYKITPSVEINNGRRKNWIPAFEMGLRSLGQANLEENFSERVHLSLENQITFAQRFGGHNITATAVHHVRKIQGNVIQGNATGFLYENLNTFDMASEDGKKLSGYFSPFTSESYLGRLIYDFKSKYLLTASLRRDGNSRFGPANQWGTFPSLSAAWKINEDFLTSIEEISMLKVRAGWGRTGNSDIGDFQYQSLMDPFRHFSPVFGVDQRVFEALNVIHSMGNPGVRWEAAEMLNFGVDLNLFADQIQLSAEYYVKDQNDMLVKQEMSSAFGRVMPAGSPWVNVGRIQNRGFEFLAIYRKMAGDFYYNVTANLTTVKNEVTSIPASVLQNNNITREGSTIGSFFGYVAERIITPADFDEAGNYLYAQPSQGTPKPGDLMFRDLNNDGIINDLDRTIIGKVVPDFTYSFNVELVYKSFDFSLFLFGMHNYQVYNHLRARMEGFESQDKFHNKLNDFVNNYYREDRPSTRYIRADLNNTNQNDRTSTWYLEDASFLRIKDLQLGYTLPKQVLQNLGLASLRIYGSASNLFTITKYTGRDPEAPTVTSGNNFLNPGNDNGTYPVPRIFSVGVQVDI